MTAAASSREASQHSIYAACYMHLVSHCHGAVSQNSSFLSETLGNIRPLKRTVRLICPAVSIGYRTWRFGLVGNVVGRINEVNQRRARLVLGWVTVFKTGKPSLYVTSHPGQLSLAIPPRVGKMSRPTGDDYGHRQGRNGEFCVTVGPVTRTADILTQSVIWRTWLYASLIGFNPRRLKVLKRG